VGFGPTVAAGPDLEGDIDRLRAWYDQLAGRS
jgi:hypothetical protein